jgi:hypothetical protein
VLVLDRSDCTGQELALLRERSIQTRLPEAVLLLKGGLLGCQTIGSPALGVRKSEAA